MSSDFNIALMQIFTAKMSGMVMKVCIIIITITPMWKCTPKYSFQKEKSFQKGIFLATVHHRLTIFWFPKEPLNEPFFLSVKNILII